MRRSSMVFGAIASLAAPVAGMMAYQSWAPGSARATDTAAASSSVGTTTTPVVQYRPCAPPARLEDGACVTHRVKLVVAPAPGVPISDPATADPDPALPSDDASPAHPIHPLPTHEVDPGEEPAPEPPDGPTAGPSAPSCEESDEEAEEPGETEGADDIDDSEHPAGDFFDRMAALVSDPDVVPVNVSDSDCADHDHDDDDEDGDDDDHAGYGDEED